VPQNNTNVNYGLINQNGNTFNGITKNFNQIGFQNQITSFGHSNQNIESISSIYPTQNFNQTTGIVNSNVGSNILNQNNAQAISNTHLIMRANIPNQ
jgi:hypothetical protein